MTAGVFDCERCGACCLAGSWDSPTTYFVDLTPREARQIQSIDLGLVAFEKTRFGRKPVMDVEGPRCAALDGTIGQKVGCSIYADRPRVCRDFEAGNTLCRAFRKERGIVD